ncbi:hypothetical protein Glove_60g53 [Diversispora epigaea]|uniref:Uncharacterized protein n=1 Tax=Diversispora epigaea TaxID=1348612 RepID=A0A397JBU6_9GLOM|nr:hypothetical protein Glove_60g53 [Diversispora epigaea]
MFQDLLEKYEKVIKELEDIKESSNIKSNTISFNFYEVSLNDKVTHAPSWVDDLE